MKAPHTVYQPRSKRIMLVTVFVMMTRSEERQNTETERDLVRCGAGRKTGGRLCTLISKERSCNRISPACRSGLLCRSASIACLLQTRPQHNPGPAFDHTNKAEQIRIILIVLRQGYHKDGTSQAHIGFQPHTLGTHNCTVFEARDDPTQPNVRVQLHT